MEGRLVSPARLCKDPNYYNLIRLILMIMNIMNVKDVKNVIHDDARVGDGNSDDDYDDYSRVSKTEADQHFLQLPRADF